MTAQADLKDQLIMAISLWVRTEHLSQREAARRLGIEQPVVNEILKGRSRYAPGWLLDAWVTSGGTWELKLGRDHK